MEQSVFKDFKIETESDFKAACNQDFKNSKFWEHKILSLLFARIGKKES